MYSAVGVISKVWGEGLRVLGFLGLGFRVFGLGDPKMNLPSLWAPRVLRGIWWLSQGFRCRVGDLGFRTPEAWGFGFRGLRALEP